MFSIIHPTKLLGWILKAYGTLLFLFISTLLFINPDLSATAVLKVILGGAAALEFTLIILACFFWRKLWARFPKLNEILFPDLNGDWDMNITWNSKEGNGAVTAIATIKHSLISVSMEVRSKGSDSETIVVKTAKDPISGRPLIYYLYRVIPKNIGASYLPYEGASTLKPFSEEGGVLRGNYFTNRDTNGHFELRR